MITLSGDGLRAKINPLGAELTTLTDAAGREWMSDGDPAFWTGRSPLLFPIVGALKGGVYRLGGATYALPQHGFARRRTFDLVEQSGDRARFRLAEDAETLAVYPFPFALDADYAISGGTLTMAISVTNTGDVDLPASFGFHPAFAWGGGPHHILFEREEPALLSRIVGGLIGPADRPSPLDGRNLTLVPELFDNDALVWERIESESVLYGAEGGSQLRIDFPGAPMLGIWSKPGARFVCVEPWWGIADPVGFVGEIWDKPGMMRFAPGEARTFTMRVTPGA
jgi:galactose mutarotase-like enzyme